MYNNLEQHSNAKNHFTVIEQYWKTVSHLSRLRPLNWLSSLFKCWRWARRRYQKHVLLNASKTTRISNHTAAKVSKAQENAKSALKTFVIYYLLRSSIFSWSFGAPRTKKEQPNKRVKENSNITGPCERKQKCFTAYINRTVGTAEGEITRMEYSKEGASCWGLSHIHNNPDGSKRSPGRASSCEWMSWWRKLGKKNQTTNTEESVRTSLK